MRAPPFPIPPPPKQHGSAALAVALHLPALSTSLFFRSIPFLLRASHPTCLHPPTQVDAGARLRVVQPHGGRRGRPGKDDAPRVLLQVVQGRRGRVRALRAQGDGARERGAPPAGGGAGAAQRRGARAAGGRGEGQLRAVPREAGGDRPADRDDGGHLRAPPRAVAHRRAPAQRAARAARGHSGPPPRHEEGGRPWRLRGGLRVPAGGQHPPGTPPTLPSAAPSAAPCRPGTRPPGRPGGAPTPPRHERHGPPCRLATHPVRLALCVCSRCALRTYVCGDRLPTCVRAVRRKSASACRRS